MLVEQSEAVRIGVQRETDVSARLRDQGTDARQVLRGGFRAMEKVAVGAARLADGLGSGLGRDVPLGPFTTYRVGGPAALFVELAGGTIFAPRLVVDR